MKKFLYLCCVLCNLFFSVNLFAAFDSANIKKNTEPLKIALITPSGNDVPPGREILFTFSRPVVPIGRMERSESEIPISIEPHLNCEWRWLNTTSLACQLREGDRMAPSTRYNVIVHPGIATEDGFSFEHESVHSFITQRPRIVTHSIKSWKSAGTPVIEVWFDQQVSRMSVVEHLYFATSTGERKSISVEESVKYQNTWLISPKEELTLDEKVELRVEPGIISLEGPEPGIENIVVAEVNTFPEFRFIGAECRDNHGNEVRIEPGEALQNNRCNSRAPVDVIFSSPISETMINENIVLSPALPSSKDTPSWQGSRYEYERLYSFSHKKGGEYRTSLYGGLKPNKRYGIAGNATKIKDIFGRLLSQNIELEIFTDHLHSDYTMPDPFFVLEKGEDTDASLVVTNMNEMRFGFETLGSKGKRSDRKTLKIDRPKDANYKIPIHARDMIKEPSGIVNGRFDTTPLISPKDNDRWFFGQTTPYNVHVKAGRDNILVWVTGLSTGLPVSDVQVRIYKDTFSSFTERQDNLSYGVTDSSGVALLDGTAKVSPVNFENQVMRDNTYLFISCRKGSDMASIPLAAPFLIEKHRDFIADGFRRGRDELPPYTWGTTSQGVYKTGDIVQYKFYVRDYGEKGFIPASDRGYSLKVIGSDRTVVHEIRNLALSEFGSFSGEFVLPKAANMGWYVFELQSMDKTWLPMRLLVADFTPAPFSVKSRLTKDLFKAGETMEVSTSASLNSGGPYVNGRGLISARFEPASFIPKEQMTTGFFFDTLNGARSRDVYKTEANTDEEGRMSTIFSIDDSSILYGRVMVEGVVQDERGKSIAAKATSIYAGRTRYVGIRQDEFVLHIGKPLKVEAIVANELGSIVYGMDIDIKIEHDLTAKEKGKDVFIAPQDRRWEVVKACKLKSASGAVSCEFVPTEPGNYRLTASIVDTRGLPHSSAREVPVFGKERLSWEAAEEEKPLEVSPEKETFKVGETARYLVRNTVPGTKALVTVERNGVVRQWVEALKDVDSTIEFPVTPELYPGFYLSVLSISPRIDKPERGGDSDPGKPAFKRAKVRTYVDDDKTIAVEVKPLKDVYRPRENVTVDLRASIPSIGNDKKQSPIELAVIVLDEAVFELLKDGRDYFDPYKGFYSHKIDPIGVTDFSLLARLIGRQRFGEVGDYVYIDRSERGGGSSIALAHMAGEGLNRPSEQPEAIMRTISRFVGYWNPSVKTDSKGMASISFKAPDNLTNWRVIVLAVTSGEYMGLGDGTFKVNNPIEIRPVLPNQVAEGDSFQGGFSVMNRGDAPTDITVTIRAEGALEAKNGRIEIREKLHAKPFQRNTIWLPVKAKEEGAIIFTAQAGDERDTDALQGIVPVRLAASLETAATYGTTEAFSITESVSYPKGIRTDIGKVSLVVSPSMIGNMEGAFRFMRDYPYGCWEQKLSKAVMGALYSSLKQYLAGGLEWERSDRLPQETLVLSSQYQSQNGGMQYFTGDGKADPYLSAYTALTFNWLRSYGYKIPEEVEYRLHQYLLGLIRHNAWPDLYPMENRPTVTAVALAALAQHEKINMDDIKKTLTHAPEMTLFGKAHFLKALFSLPDTKDIQMEIVKMILSHANMTGGKVVFSEMLDYKHKGVLTSSLRDNGAILSALLEYAEKTTEADILLGDIPVSLARTIMEARESLNPQKNVGGQAGKSPPPDHWGNTQENVFCLNAIYEFSRIYEKNKPNMKISAWLDKEAMGQASFKDYYEAAIEFSRPIKENDPGKKEQLILERTGNGRIYYSARLSFAPSQLKLQPINSGIEVHREYKVERNGKWVLLDKEMSLKTGELVRVDIYLSLPAARYFVVADDPVPGGLEPVNQDLATTSSIDAGKRDPNGGELYFMGQRYSTLGYQHKELRNDAVRFYSEYLPAGNYNVSYIAQAIAPGKFTVMPLHAEEMYDPDVFGKGSPAQLIIERSN